VPLVHDDRRPHVLSSEEVHLVLEKVLKKKPVIVYVNKVKSPDLGWAIMIERHKKDRYRDRFVVFIHLGDQYLVGGDHDVELGQVVQLLLLDARALVLGV
jgi:hypothetical protein